MSLLETLLAADPDAVAPSGRAKVDVGLAVEGGRLRYLSVSAVSTADTSQDGGCLRKWYFEKVARLPRPPSTKSQELGTRVHAEIEHYLKTGEDVLGPIARIGKHFLPKPGTVEVEKAIGLDEKGRLRHDLVALGIPFLGFVDAANLSGTWVDPQGEERAEDVPELLDWKTSKDVARYAKAGSALIRTVQMVGYGKYALDVLAPRAERVRVSHVTFPTAGPKTALKTTAVLDRLTIDARWLKVSDTVAGMVQAATETDAAKVAANTQACGAFGGCPYADTCKPMRSVRETLKDAFGVKGDSFMGILDRITAAKPQEEGMANETTKPFGGARPGIDKMPPGLTLADKKTWIKAAQEYELAEAEREEAEAKAAEEAKILAEKFPPKPAAQAKPAATKPPATIATTTGAVKASTARQGKHYLVEMGAETYNCQYVGLTKGGYAFAHPDLDSTIILTPDDLVLPSDAVVPPDAPKKGESGPVALPVPEGAVVPANVRAAADRVAPEQPKEPAPEKVKKPRKGKTTEAVPAPANAPEIVAAAAKALSEIPPAPSEAVPSSVGETYRRTPVASTLPVREPVDPGPAAEEPVDPDERPALTPKGAAVAPAGFVLLVDCVPTAGTSSRNISSIVEVVQEAMRETFKCVDIRSADSDRLAFGRWKGAFAAGLRAYHDEHPLTGYVVAEARGSELLGLAVETLAPLASVVIRGV